MLSINIQFKILFLLVLLTCSTRGSPSKKRVCVIGAGVAGLVSVKYLTAQSDKFETIAFDQNSDVGGMWIYTDSQDVDKHGLPVHSSMYKYLRTILPKEFMAFPDYQKFHGESRSYVRHETVLEYLQNYTNHFNLRSYIQFDTLVTKVSPVAGLKWRMQTINLNTFRKNETLCDSVVVANGYLSKPNIPKIPGIEKFPGRIIHSHIYRRPEEFINQTIILLGASYSGLEIGIELSNYAKTVYLSHRHDKIIKELPNNLIQVPGIAEANNEGLILSNGSKIVADSLMFCTGYVYDFPFLDEKSGIKVTKGKYVHPLYKHIVNVEYPTMFFINIPQPGLMFWIANGQARYVAAILSGKVKLPSYEKMLEDAALPMGSSVEKAHHLFLETGPYYEELARAGGFPLLPPHFEESVIKYLVDKEENPLHYKEKNLRQNKDGRWEIYQP